LMPRRPVPHNATEPPAASTSPLGVIVIEVGNGKPFLGIDYVNDSGALLEPHT
jgi:hypothetical protein